MYHWRRRFRRIGIGVTVAVAGLALGTVVATGPAYVAGLALVFAGLWYGQSALKRLLVPAPWQSERWPYVPLRHALDLDGADRWLDVGCGTGRSLVALAGDDVGSDAEPVNDTRVTALDTFDARIILGNGARYARRNAATVGLNAAAVAGDATRLPVRSGSQDVVTACLLLHDLPRPDAVASLREARRVLADGGQIGLLEPHVTHERTDDVIGYWEAVLADEGFEVIASGEVSRGGSWYCYLVGSPSASAE
ncbi:class I SAM-dependent methyltransferase [Halorarum halobium]|uniref:class I SAM-dependent methyltransferase n=1 Tax=Halorarum halobium TaxID=3075121 RepID=UPI0028AC6A56|nr:class I SAM-dependent methyltransferase [Halobaculum sp. XH14]